jgi:alpha-L-fucosidase
MTMKYISANLPHILSLGLCTCALVFAPAHAQAVSKAAPAAVIGKNDPVRVEAFRDDGLGLFIHWGVDGPLGGGISHSLVGASDDYKQKFFTELPHSFAPFDYRPAEIARLAKLAGFHYVVFTAKHHAGFCMWDTDTTDFDIEHTPYGKDLLRETIDAFRAEGIKVGIYYSPDDFWWLWKHNIEINRHVVGTYPQDIPDLMAYSKAQLKELLTRYGRIDYLFVDGPADGLKEYAWSLQPNLVVTRGEIQTPEQYTPGVAPDGAWEGNLTMGTEWSWRANDKYKSATEIIQTFIETRAKGGNFLLNIGPRPDGTLAPEQDARLREIALWNFINDEAVTAVRPWTVTNEGDIWFTRAKDADTVYAIITGEKDWPLGSEKKIILKSVKGTSATHVSVLGQNDKIVEYQPKADAQTRGWQDKDGYHIRLVKAQRLYTDNSWSAPVVVKIENAQSAISLPKAVLFPVTSADLTPGRFTVHGELTDLGNADSLDVSLQYRMRPSGKDFMERGGEWIDIPMHKFSKPGKIDGTFTGLKSGRKYDYRIRIHSSGIDIYSSEGEFTAMDIPG